MMTKGMGRDDRLQLRERLNRPYVVQLLEWLFSRRPSSIVLSPKSLQTRARGFVLVRMQRTFACPLGGIDVRCGVAP